MATHALHAVLRRVSQGDHHGFKVKLGYRRAVSKGARREVRDGFTRAPKGLLPHDQGKVPQEHTCNDLGRNLVLKTVLLLPLAGTPEST